MSLLNRQQFTSFAPKAILNTLPALEAAIIAYPQLADKEVLDDWLGQMHVESAGFSTMVENLNYSVDSLIALFSRARISLADAQHFGRIDKVVNGKKVVVRQANQSAIANLIYGGAWGKEHLGNTEPGDGWKYRGSGFKQITGRYNTEKSGFTPDELRGDVFKSALAAAQFFVSRGCIGPAKAGDIREVTRLINGGQNGYDDRVARTVAARKVIL
ncbi:chitinase [Asticcacaulis sp. AC466]|uniref:glycoside hydrolase family 19 protein n=1 Tax=Asticcacaulis sp. AC466 TaxID=1282362 RepID=UPI0003C4111B|nr:chitinase [Asticcacaulis sp. AC466]ESQ85381.1 chitinase [Asticcacaulis sp. AC466]